MLTVQELIDAVGGRLVVGKPGPSAPGSPLRRIATDSRDIKPGDVFWARIGSQRDGADFAEHAFARGAAGVVAQRPIQPWAERWSVCVHDSQWALWQLAAEVRRRFAGQVSAVTGSVGKTTTRHMIHALLAAKLAGATSPRNYNNHVGVPLSMLAWQPNQDYAVVELGASRTGEIDALAALCRPQIGVLTCVGEAHLGPFGGQQAIAQAKAELLAALPKDGWAVLNADDPWTRRIAGQCRARTLWTGCSADADVVATDVCSEQGWLRFRVEGYPLRVPVWGRHHLTSALAAVAVGRILGQSLDAIAGPLGRFEALPRRCQISQRGGISIIDDTYNASPTAMKAALQLLRDFAAPGRRVVVCGDMLELGPTADRWHHQLGRQVARVGGADLLIACGRHARQVVTGARDTGMPVAKAIACRQPHDALPVLSEWLAPGDVVLVKGSRALAMDKIVDLMRRQPEPVCAE